MNTLLVTGAAVVGLALGGALDPVGQRLADRSHAAEERRRAEERAEQRAAHESSRGDGPTPEVGHHGSDGPPKQGPHVGGDVDRPPSGGSSMLQLLASGRSPGRTAASALVTGALFGAAAAHFGAHLVLAPFCVFFAMLVVISVTDLSHRLIPRHVLYAAMALVVPLLLAVAATGHAWHDLAGSAIAGAIAFGLFFAIWWFVPKGMGFGDVRLAGAIGFTVGFLSLLHAYVAFLAGFVVGMVFGLGMMALSSSGRKTRIPFAPSLAVGAVIGVFWGGYIAHTLFHAGS